MQPSFSDLSEDLRDDATLPPLDRSTVDPTKLDWPEHEFWKNGAVVLKKWIPDHLIEDYCALRARLPKPGGWTCPTPYLYYPQIKDICLYRPLTDVLARLIGEPMGLHLNLTGWVSTEREWHQDDYLNPDFVRAHYLAVWIALDDVNPESGPFQWVPGSHRWPLLRRDKVYQHLGYAERSSDHWPSHAQRFVTPACEAEIAARGGEIKEFHGKRGDVLIWHGRLIHQGSKPKIPGAERKALISHYSALSKRLDMPVHRRYAVGHLDVDGFFFDLNVALPPDECV